MLVFHCGLKLCWSLFAFPLALMRDGCMFKTSSNPEVRPHHVCAESVIDFHALLTRARLEWDGLKSK